MARRRISHAYVQAMVAVVVSDTPITWDWQGLVASGFEGFVPFAALPIAKVPKMPGVYVVLRPSAEPPTFLERSVAGWFKGNDPTVPLLVLDEAWVRGATIVYIGKANWGTNQDGLRRRLSEYRRHGEGKAVGHRGGEYIWQLKDSDELLVCWKMTDDEDVKSLESRLIYDFEARNGRWPFANRKPEGRRIQE